MTALDAGDHRLADLRADREVSLAPAMASPEEPDEGTEPLIGHRAIAAGRAWPALIRGFAGQLFIPGLLGTEIAPKAAGSRSRRAWTSASHALDLANPCRRVRGRKSVEIRADVLYDER